MLHIFVSSIIHAQPKEHLRGVWIANVGNVDWPSTKGLSAEEQQAELIAYLDMAQDLKLNTVFFQIRNACDAVYYSQLEPWSEWLTGKQGQSPGYDPLEFLIREARKRRIEVHAWLNPYRAITDVRTASIASNHVSKVRPDVLLSYGHLRLLNPGLPEVRAFVNRVVMDVVRRYDIAGIHFDDYFYPYPQKGATINDFATFKTHNRGIKNVADWRRDNVNLLIKAVSDSIKAVKPHIRFGISPFGIWQNSTTSALGSDTGGLESYSTIYADSRKWATEGWIDYIVPQLYWHIGNNNADFATLLDWWCDNASECSLYVGHAAYKIGSGDAAWHNPAELMRQVSLVKKQAQGSVFFSAKSLKNNRLGIKEVVRSSFADATTTQLNAASLPQQPATAPEVSQPTAAPSMSRGSSTDLEIASPPDLPNEDLPMQVFPNPFNQQVGIRYKLATSAQVSVYVYDARGTRVGVLIDNKPQQAGEYSLRFNGQFLEEGTYFAHLIADNKQKRMKIILAH